jgi:transcription elongation factor Elf1
MTAEAKKEEEKTKKEKPREIKFKCQRCQREVPLGEMVSITRFRPVLIVCRNCAEEMR